MDSAKTYGLIGFPLSHSFSAGYFKKKFEKEGVLDVQYLNFEIPSINEVLEVIKSNPSLKGINVTIPYKEQILPFLDKLDEAARPYEELTVYLCFACVQSSPRHSHLSDWGAV